MMTDLNVQKYFNFLVTEYNFNKPVTYNYVKEIHTDYIKENIVVKIIYEGTYSCALIKLDKIDKDLLAEKKRLIEINYNSMTYYNLSELDRNKKLYKSVSKFNFPDKELWYYSTLLKNNSELLQGDFSKFSTINRFLRKIGLR